MKPRERIFQEGERGQLLNVDQRPTDEKREICRLYLATWRSRVTSYLAGVVGAEARLEWVQV